jgi:hypothetical protein
MRRTGRLDRPLAGLFAASVSIASPANGVAANRDAGWALVSRPSSAPGHGATARLWVGLKNASPTARILCGDHRVGFSLRSGTAGPTTIWPGGVVDHRCTTADSWHLVQPGETLFSLRSFELAADTTTNGVLMLDVAARDAVPGGESRGFDLTAAVRHWKAAMGSPARSGDVRNGSWLPVVRPAPSPAKGVRSYWIGFQNRSRDARAICGYFRQESALDGEVAAVKSKSDRDRPDCREEGRRLVLPNETYLARYDVGVATPGAPARVTILFGSREVGVSGDVLPGTLEARWVEPDTR